MTKQVGVRRAVTALGLVIGLVLASPVLASDGNTVVIVRGRVTDVHGNPMWACVSLKAQSPWSQAFPLVRLLGLNEDIRRETGVGLERTYTDEDGYYAIAAPPGESEFIASEARESSLGVACTDPHGFEYTPRTKRVNTLMDLGPSDFVLPYKFSGGIEPYAQPGDVVSLAARVAQRVGDATATFTDETSGETISLARTVEYSPYRDPVWLFTGSYAVPADRQDGLYETTFSLTVPGLPGAADDLASNLTVDTLPPDIVDTWPRPDSGPVGPALLPAFWPGDLSAAGVSCPSSSVTIYEITASGERIQVPQPEPGTMEGWIDRCRWRGNPYQLEAGFYEAEFLAVDRARNSTTEVVGFEVSNGPRFSNPSPTGTNLSPASILEVTAELDVDPQTVTFFLKRLPPVGMTKPLGRGQHDPETRRFWIDFTYANPEDELGTAASKWVLTPGQYEVEIRGRDLSARPFSFKWEFEQGP